MNLYFVDKDRKEHLVKEEVIPEGMGRNIMPLVLEDLKTRLPDFKSSYQRTWWDNFFRLWIDFGSHTEFYIVQSAAYVLNEV